MKWADIRPGDSFLARPMDHNDTVEGVYVVLSVRLLPGAGEVVSLRALLSTGCVEEWSGDASQEYYWDVPVGRLP